MFILRPDQQDAKRAFMESTAHSVVVQASTGYGKTVLSSDICKSWPGRVLFMVHRVGLVRQKSEKLTHHGVEHGIWIGGNASNVRARVQVASIQTLAATDDLPELGPGDLIIIDECHRADANKIRHHYFAPRVLGFTATPCSDSGMPLKGYQQLITTAQPRELARLGALVEGTVFSVDLFDGDDIDTAKLADFLQKEGVVSRYCDTIAAWAPEPTVVFCQTIPHARHVKDQLVARGVRAVVMDSSMDGEEKDAAMLAFKSGEADVICNANILIEGWDHPQLRRVVMLRPTDSLVVFLQQYGRGTRPANGKTSWECWDFAGNVIRHLDPFMDRQWSLDTSAARNWLMKRRAAGVWRCPECFTCCEPQRVVGGKCPRCGVAVVATARISTRSGRMVRWDVAQLAKLKDAKEAEAAVKAANARRIKDLWRWAYSRGLQNHAAQASVMKQFQAWKRSGAQWEKFYQALWARGGA